MSWRATVVWRPVPSSASAFVACASCPSRRLASVDLPTPEEPSSATVFAGPRYGASSSSPSPVTLLTTCADAPSATCSAWSSSASGSSQRSAFVSTSAGIAPLSQARVR